MALYSRRTSTLLRFRNDCAADLPGTLAAVAKMGYTGVEFAGYYDRNAKELRTMLDDLGLKCCGTAHPHRHPAGRCAAGDRRVQPDPRQQVPGRARAGRGVSQLGRRLASHRGHLQRDRRAAEALTACSPATTTTPSSSSRWTANCRGTPSSATPGLTSSCRSTSATRCMAAATRSPTWRAIPAGRSLST